MNVTQNSMIDTNFIENDYDSSLSRIAFVTTQYINNTMD